MDSDDKHQSFSFIKQSNPKLIIKFAGRYINQQQQQQCSKEAEEVVKNISVSKHNLSIINSPKSISNNSDSSFSATCSICGKSFPSKQSLFGHMRSHPEREWRGIRPPPPPSPCLSVRVLFKSSPASTGSDDSKKSVESYQGVGPLPVNWSATGKRGRKPYGSFLYSDKRITDAVEGLLMLKQVNDLDVALMNKHISRENEGIALWKKKKRVILESSSSEDLLRSSKKIKIYDQERSFSSSRDGFGPKLINNIQSNSQLEKLPASNMFQEDCGLVKNDSKKLKLTDERISCGSSRDGFDPKVMNRSHLEQLPLNGLLKNSSKKEVKLDGGGSSRDEFDPKLINNIPSSHMEQMTKSHLEHIYSNGFHGGFHLVKNSEKINNIPSSSHVQQMPPPNGYFQGMFNSVFLKPTIPMKATANKKKVKEIERAAADQDMGLQGSCSTNEFKCDTCNRIFPSHQALGGHKSSQRNCKNSSSSCSYQFPTHHDQYLQCRDSIQYISETKTKTPMTSSSYNIGGTGTHQCELCGVTFGTGQALGGHKRRHYTGTGLNSSVPFNSTAMAQTEKLIKKEEMNRLSVVALASSVGKEVISTTTTKTETKPPVLDFDLNEINLNETPDGSWR